MSDESLPPPPASNLPSRQQLWMLFALLVIVVVVYELVIKHKPTRRGTRKTAESTAAVSAGAAKPADALPPGTFRASPETTSRGVQPEATSAVRKPVAQSRRSDRKRGRGWQASFLVGSLTLGSLMIWRLFTPDRRQQRLSTGLSTLSGANWEHIHAVPALDVHEELSKLAARHKALDRAQAAVKPRG